MVCRQTLISLCFKHSAWFCHGFSSKTRCRFSFVLRSHPQWCRIRNIQSPCMFPTNLSSWLLWWWDQISWVIVFLKCWVSSRRHPPLPCSSEGYWFCHLCSSILSGHRPHIWLCGVSLQILISNMVIQLAFCNVRSTYDYQQGNNVMLHCTLSYFEPVTVHICSLTSIFLTYFGSQETR